MLIYKLLMRSQTALYANMKVLFVVRNQSSILAA